MCKCAELYTRVFAAILYLCHFSILYFCVGIWGVVIIVIVSSDTRRRSPDALRQEEQGFIGPTIQQNYIGCIIGSIDICIFAQFVFLH
jgi:hypothetical protein